MDESAVDVRTERVQRVQRKGFNCTPHDVATGETDLEACEEIAGRARSAWKELREMGALVVIKGGTGTWRSSGRARRNE